jgi:hypothetical protein
MILIYISISVHATRNPNNSEPGQRRTMEDLAKWEEKRKPRRRMRPPARRRPQDVTQKANTPIAIGLVWSNSSSSPTISIFSLLHSSLCSPKIINKQSIINLLALLFRAGNLSIPQIKYPNRNASQQVPWCDTPLDFHIDPSNPDYSLLPRLLHCPHRDFAVIKHELTAHV